ncbi:MAG: hypothetical protein IH960_08515, partial [Chloroflexi bacterium]|nr:hypothetical protein [Chloroflexota bacterium]
MFEAYVPEYGAKDDQNLTGGISYMGGSAEERFFRITNATVPVQTSDGDAVLDGHLVEIKQGESTTINQVRAVKYIPLVYWSSRTESWYVVPPNEIVKLVAAKPRGQHTENPFESNTLSLAKVLRYKVEEHELRQSVLDAVSDGASHSKLQQAMHFVLIESRKLAKKSRLLVNEALDGDL